MHIESLCIYFVCVITIVCGKMNVLFLVADDMRPQLGAYYGPDFPSPTHPKMQTPNIDKLAARSLLFKRAYVQQAICSPSRTSLLTGRRPDTTHVYDLKTYWRKVGGNFTTIPQYFKENGYRSVGMGKIFHPGKKASGEDDPISWSEPYWHAPAHAHRSWWREFGKQHSWYAVNTSMIAKHGKLSDQQIGDHAVETLRRLAKTSRQDKEPFFLAVGFHKPHLPFIFPDEFLKLYPLSDIKLPDNPYAPVNMPSVAWSYFEELRKYGDIKKLNASGAINTTFPDRIVRELRRAYYCATSYTDFEVGRVLSELDHLGLSNNTLISFWGDHGWQLGEHGEWTKHTNFELATHAPLMVRAPGITDKGIQTEALTEFVDLFPTLVDLAGLPRIPTCPPDSSAIEVCTEGVSLVPLIHNPSQPWKPRVFSQYNRNGTKIMGYTMRTDRYRYTEWPRFHKLPNYLPNWKELYGIELYDHTVDPEENHNIAYESQTQSLRKELSNLLHKGWRNSFPPGNRYKPSYIEDQGYSEYHDIL